jgi:hypothetical protein
MALLFMDGFEMNQYFAQYSNNGSSGRWASVTSPTFAAGGVGSQPAGSTARYLSSYGNSSAHSCLNILSNTTVILGCHYRNTNIGATGIINVTDTDTGQSGYSRGVKIYLNANGSLAVMSNTTVLCTSLPSILIENTWCHLELKVVFGVTGSVELKQDGATVCSNPNVDTRGSVTGGYTKINFAQSYYHNYDNLYVLNELGSVNNDFLGPVVVQTMIPNGAGSATNMTPSSGNNYECVDDSTTHDSATSYVKTSSTSTTDLYALPDLAGTVTAVHAVLVTSQTAQWDTVTQRKVRNIVKVGANTGSGVTYNLINSTWTQGIDVLDAQPVTSGAWTEAAVNGMEVGFETVP